MSVHFCTGACAKCDGLSKGVFGVSSDELSRSDSSVISEYLLQ